LPFRSSGPLDAWMKKLQNDLTPPRRLVPALSERIDWAITRAMSADRDRRPKSCREFVEDLTGHSTRRMQTAIETGTPASDMWYLVYKDENGTLHTVKGSTNAIRRSLRDGMLGDASNIRAARSKTGPFEPLRDYPEFRDIVVAPEMVSVAAPAGNEEVPTKVTEPPVPPEDPLAPSARVKATTRATSKVMAPAAVATEDPPPDDEQAPPSSYEWLKWLVLIVLAAGAVLGYLWLLGR
jgi:eukaryotic-like serine/threonine-protein kinase